MSNNTLAVHGTYRFEYDEDDLNTTDEDEQTEAAKDAAQDALLNNPSLIRANLEVSKLDEVEDPTEESNDQPNIVSEYVSENGTAYAIQVQRVHAQDNNAFEKRHISTPFTLYTIFTGPDVHSHHDKYKLIRQMTGDASWLHDHFDRLEEQVR